MANRVCERCIHYDVCLLHEDNFIDDVNIKELLVIYQNNLKPKNAPNNWICV